MVEYNGSLIDKVEEAAQHGLGDLPPEVSVLLGDLVVWVVDVWDAMEGWRKAFRRLRDIARRTNFEKPVEFSYATYVASLLLDRDTHRRKLQELRDRCDHLEAQVENLEGQVEHWRGRFKRKVYAND